MAASLENSRAEYRRLGNSGLHVSVPIPGCMSIGSPEWADWVIGGDQALTLLKAAYDRGVNTARAPLPMLRRTYRMRPTMRPGEYILYGAWWLTLCPKWDTAKCLFKWRQ